LRGDGAAFAGDFCRDALRELADGAVVEQEGKFGLPSMSMKPGDTMRPEASISRLA